MATYTIPVQSLKISSDFIQSDEIQVLRSQVWWNKFYGARRNLRITATPDGLTVGHPITAFVPKNISLQGKVQNDFKDLEVLRLVSTVPDVWERLPRTIESLSTHYRVRFLLKDLLKDNESTDKYYIYYSNPFRNTPYPLGNPYKYDSSELDWPISIEYSDSLISYTRPGEHWNSGKSEISGAKATMQFYGPQVRIFMDTGPDCGQIEVQVDTRSWEKIDLYKSASAANSLVYNASQLGDGMHEIRVKVLGQKNPASSSASVRLRSIQYKKHSVAQDLGEEQYIGYNWAGRIMGS